MARSIRGRDIGDFHWIMTKTPDGDDFVILSGIAYVALQGAGGDWKTESFIIELPPLPHPRSAEGYYWYWNPLKHWVPLATLSEIYHQRDPGIAGWSVNHFGVSLATLGGWENQAVVNVGTAVRDSNGTIARLGFHVTLIGRLTEKHTKVV
jgi:hypothetical protein